MILIKLQITVEMCRSIMFKFSSNAHRGKKSRLFEDRARQVIKYFQTVVFLQHVEQSCYLEFIEPRILIKLKLTAVSIYTSGHLHFFTVYSGMYCSVTSSYFSILLS